ncbi:MAG: LysR substrate-binding domain-containing protein [Dokdonella sp.]
MRFAVVGAPDYFARHARPRTPADLVDHRCIRTRLPSGAIYRWEFEKHPEELAVDVDGLLTLDSPDGRGRAARHRPDLDPRIRRRAAHCRRPPGARAGD